MQEVVTPLLLFILVDMLRICAMKSTCYIIINSSPYIHIYRSNGLINGLCQ